MRLIIPKRPAVKVEDAFSTTLYTGTGAARDIVTGIDLVNHDGLVWIKNRSTAVTHYLFDTARGNYYALHTSSTTYAAGDADSFSSFNDDGFSMGSYFHINQSEDTFASWTFRKARRFFDVAEVTKSSGTDATVSFPTLGTLGMVVVKRTDSSGSWYVWHRSLTAGKLLLLNTKDAETTRGDVTISGTTVTLEDAVLADGDYIVYAWAHNINSRGIVQCGSYAGNSSATGPEIDLGWRPQFLIVKRITLSYDWLIHDNKRDTSNPRTAFLRPNGTDIETDGPSFGINFLSTGFQPATDQTPVNNSGDTYIYLAIREE